MVVNDEIAFSFYFAILEMNLHPIKTQKEYESMLTWIDRQFDRRVDINSAMGKQLQIALLLIKQYEDEHYAIPEKD